MTGSPAGPEGEAPTGPAPRREAWQWTVGHAVAAFAAGIGASLLAALAVAPGGITSFETFAVIGPAQALVSITVVAVLGRFPPPGREGLGLRFAPVDGLAVLLGSALQFGLSLLLSLVVVVFLGGEAPVQEVVQIVDEAADPGTRAAVVITAVVLAPLAEELVFRGVLLRALARRYPGWPAAFGSAAAFALAHLLDANAGLAVPAFLVMGLVLARLVQASGRLGGAVATHAGFNLLSVLLLFFA
ncbi:MAG: abortive infection protein [Acidobacteria bacterium]|nr:abortive infection protein [Acidobacteriota bacterium]